jgi:hypothetical protein
MKDRGLIYLASPYSHEDPRVREWRFRAAAWYASTLMQRGWLVFSPIAHTHPIAEFGLPKGWDFWKQYDEKFLDACGGLVVLCIDGWKESVGVRGRGVDHGGSRQACGVSRFSPVWD